MATATKAPVPSKRVTLADLGNDLAVVDAWLDEHDDEMRENEGVVPDALAALLEQVEGELAGKIERIGLYIRALLQKSDAAKAEKASLKAELDFYAAREKRYITRADALKRYTLGCLVRMGRKKIEGDTLDVRCQRNGQPSVTLPEADQKTLGDMYLEGKPFVSCEVTYSFDTVGIRSVYDQAVAEIGPMPDVESERYVESLAAWTELVHEHMYASGVPLGVRVDHGMHVRFS